MDLKLHCDTIYDWLAFLVQVIVPSIWRTIVCKRPRYNISFFKKTSKNLRIYLIDLAGVLLKNLKESTSKLIYPFRVLWNNQKNPKIHLLYTLLGFAK
jgi:hypothetical protein